MKTILQMIALCGCVLATPAWAQNATIGIEHFDSWIFQGYPNRDQAKSTLESQIDLEIMRIAQTVSLTDDQKERLKLAGNGDVKRFYDRVEKARRQFLSMDEQWEQNRVKEAIQLAMPLQDELAIGIFGSESLLKKVVSTTVTQEQTDQMRKETERLLQLRKESAVKVMMANLGRQIPMTSTQRSKLTELLMQRMTSIGDDDVYTSYLPYLAAYRLSEVPLDDYKDLFDEAQMKAINQSTQQGKAMKDMLEQQGLLDEKP